MAARGGGREAPVSSARSRGAVPAGRRAAFRREPIRSRARPIAARRCGAQRRQSRWISYDLEVALQFPIGHRVERLPPFPLASRGEMIDEIVAEPVAGDLRLLEVA